MESSFSIASAPMSTPPRQQRLHHPLLPRPKRRMAKVLFQSRVEIVLHLQGISQCRENRTPFLAWSPGF